MASRPKGYGMTAELQDKKDAKYDVAMAEEAVTWIVAITGDGGPTGYGAGEVQEWLKDGTVLCNCINTINVQLKGKPIKINTSKMAFKQMENIGNFLGACEGVGCAKQDLFQTVDLYEGENMPQVINVIFALGRKVQSRYDGPSLGAKEADKNERTFDEETLQEGKKVIGLQMGSNKGASQAGSTPYGLGRQIEKTNLKN